MKIIYPSADKIIKQNILVLSIFKAKKADKTEVLSYQKLAEITEGCESLHENKSKLRIKNDPQNAKIMIGIREKYYSDTEIKTWLQNAKIREFRKR